MAAFEHLRITHPPLGIHRIAHRAIPLHALVQRPLRILRGFLRDRQILLARRRRTGTLVGGVLTGTTANDRLSVTSAVKSVDGLGGTDTAVFSGARANYSITGSATGPITVTEIIGSNTWPTTK